MRIWAIDFEQGCHPWEEPFIRACGFGGQMLAIHPVKKMVISIFSDMDRPHPENIQILFDAFCM